MANLIPFNRKNSLANTEFDDFYFMIDDFFNGGWAERNMLRDNFKIDVKETAHDYVIEAEVPGIKKEEIELKVENQVLSIIVNREEDFEHEKKDYVHKERHVKSMHRKIRLGKAKKEKIEAMLNDGVLTIIIPKDKDAEDEFKITIK